MQTSIQSDSPASPAGARPSGNGRTQEVRMHDGHGDAAFLAAVQAWELTNSCVAPVEPTLRLPPVQVHWDESRGLLILDLDYLGQGYRVFLSVWDHGIRWASKHHGTLEIMPLALDPGLPLLNPNNPWAAPWQKRIPAGVLEALAPFTTERWAMLCWASRSSKALDLLRSAPVLLWVLLVTARSEHWSDERIESALGMKRREILAACRLNPANSTLKLLTKFQALPFGSSAFELIRLWLKDPELGHSLRHYHTVTEALLRFLRQYPELAESPLARDAPQNDRDYFRDLGQWYADTQRMRDEVGADDLNRHFYRHANLQAVRREHDRLVRRVNEQGVRPRDEQPFIDFAYPDPPLRGTETIVPITRYSELILEGKTQEHCIRSYHPDIQARGYYVYQVLHPQRATLGLRLKRGMAPRLDELKGHRNQPVSRETLESVQAWLAETLNMTSRTAGGLPINVKTGGGAAEVIEHGVTVAPGHDLQHPTD